jgi:FMN reductase
VFDVITIAGSPSRFSRSAAVLDYTRRTLERNGLRTRALHVRDLPPEDLIYGRFDSPDILEWISLLQQVRGVIVATPVYKASYSGVLKTFLDLLPQQALSGKLVLPIATGGSPAHMLAIDYALRPVLASLSAQHILNGVYIVDSQIQVTEETFQLEAVVAQRLDTALSYFADQLGAPVRENALLAHAV